jgi:hypothetical protein
MNKRHWFIVMFLILFGICLHAGEVTNFSGIWILDESKIESGQQGPRMAAKKLTITQDENQLTIERFISSQFRGDFTSNDTVTLDGKETVNKSEFGDRTLTASWSEDNKVITIKSVMEMNREGQTFQINSTEIWTLMQDGKILKIDQIRVSPRGERKSVLYYNMEKKSKAENKGN